MKKAAFLLFFSLWLAACNNNTPTGIAVKFLDCLATGEYDRAKQYCTPQGEAAVEMARQMAREGVPLINNYKIQRDSVAGDKAWVFYENTLYGRPYNANIQLVKHEGKWKVHASPIK